MPILEIDTNVAQEITPEVVQELTKLLSEMLGLGVSVRLSDTDTYMSRKNRKFRTDKFDT